MSSHPEQPNTTAGEALHAWVETAVAHPDFSQVPLVFMGRVTQEQWDDINPTTREAISEGLGAYVQAETETAPATASMVSMTGIAKALGITRQAVHNMRIRGSKKLPPPSALVDNRIAVWDKSVVEGIIQAARDSK